MNKNIEKINRYLDEFFREVSAKKFAVDFAARFVVAWTLISRIPLPRKWWPAAAVPGNKALSAAPAAGAVLGLINSLFIILLLRLGLGRYPAAWLGAACYAFCGWTLHLDGWGDLWDGIGSGKSGEELRSVMKDSRLGAYGATGLVLALGLWSSLLSSVPTEKIAAACITAAATGRLASCSAARFGLYPWDSGMAKGWVDGFSEYDLFLAFIFMLILLPLAPIKCFFSAIIAVLIGYGLACKMNSLLGGVNGDVLGASAVAAEIFSLVVFAL